MNTALVGQVAVEALAPRHAESAAHLASRLGRYAKRAALAVRDDDSLHRAPFHGEEVLARPVGRSEGLNRLHDARIALFLKQFAAGFGDVRHLREVEHALDVEPVCQLFCSECRKPQPEHRFLQFGRTFSE